MTTKQENHDYLYKSKYFLIQQRIILIQQKIQKVILVGDARVGKTSFLIRYVKGVLPKNQLPTIGVEYLSKSVLLQDGEGIVKAQIWDTSGSEKYKSITAAHYRKSVGALLFFDLCDYQSFLNSKKWLKEIENHTEEGIKIMLIGNKLDLIEENPINRQVNKEEVLEFCQKNNLIYQETSSLTGQNVKESFEFLIQQDIVSYDQQPVKQNSGCCSC
ncbi:Ras family protein, putative [Ichthyophthirius multifiliis]|uniref:Ras family protein, putative n=1 Tax=Ichthyophthirius multifiliis TaxID=5932 RepID=G0QVG9_ICHMU|nr:Ras family protein, putative [Ichthyophthirius multifiliis]EGR30779.1 Ras family protein, putative [Ichthyophthirius multifiliis]|eukprot:XP_004032366.1 Ras family protein, putative [Ichthyophthirius multifiliis]